MIEYQAAVPTPDGFMETFICHPERGGPHPVIFFYMDAPGIREELRDMARRIATVGYYVALPNLYYRSGVLELNLAEPKTPADPPRSPVADYVASISIPLIADDTKALINFVDGNDAARNSRMACIGYCMSAQHAVHAGAVHRDRVAAVASIYGTWLMTDQPDSPHLMARAIQGELYFACAEVDHWAPLALVDQLRKDFETHSVPAEVELYRGVEHAFAFPQRPAYDRAAAERHWERLFALFRRTID